MIIDWNDAYANAPHIENADQYPALWRSRAEAFRAEIGSQAELNISYGSGKRQKFDLFQPRGALNGLTVFVHGGYWKAFDKDTWSHLAHGALAHGWAVAIPSYTLAPEARISEITLEIAAALKVAAEKIEGPIRLAGHSAGGHLVARMLCRNAPLGEHLRNRIRHVLSISGLHDLRPLIRLDLNETLRLDEAEAVLESPALQYPAPWAKLTCWVGALERPEFRRQNDLLANIWTGLGATTEAVHAAKKHHFDVIADLEDPHSALTRRFVGAGD